MGFREWWDKLSYWKKGALIGAILGSIKIPLFVSFGEDIPEFIGNLLFKIPDELICNLLNLSEGEPCGFFVFFYGFVYNPIFYALIGSLVGYLYYKLRKK